MPPQRPGPAHLAPHTVRVPSKGSRPNFLKFVRKGTYFTGPPTRPQAEPARCTERSCIPRAGARGNILPRIQKSKRLVTEVGKLSKHHLEAGPPHCSWPCLPGTEAAAPRSLSSSVLDAAGIRDTAARALSPEAFRATGCLFGGSRGSRFCSSPALLDHMSPLTNDSPKHAPTFPRAPKGSPRDLGLRPGRGVSPGCPRSLPKAGRRTASRRRPPRRPSAAARRGAGLRGPQWEGCPDPASPRCGRGYTSRAVALTPGRWRPTPPAAPPRGPQPRVAGRLRPPAAPCRRQRTNCPRAAPLAPGPATTSSCAATLSVRASSGGSARPTAGSAHEGPPRDRPLPGSRRARKHGAGATERARGTQTQGLSPALPLWAGPAGSRRDHVARPLLRWAESLLCHSVIHSFSNYLECLPSAPHCHGF